MKKFFYEKHFIRPDGRVFVRQYSRSFEYGDDINPFSGEILDSEPSTPEQLVLDFDSDDIDHDSHNISNSIASSISRARNRVKILAFSNPDLVGLLTLTNADCPSEDEALLRFKNFRETVKRAGYTDFKFLGVKELQKRGSIHWHLLVNYCPGETVSPNNVKKRICSLWKFGFSDYQLINGDDKWRTELYLLKYMSKDHLKLFRQYYVRSRNLDLIKPVNSPISHPVPPQANNVWISEISNNFVDNFVITDYTINYKYLSRVTRIKENNFHEQTHYSYYDRNG